MLSFLNNRQQDGRVADIRLARFRQRARASQVLAFKPGSASSTMRRLVMSIAIAQSGKLPTGSFPSSHSWNILTAPERPCCSTENGLPNSVVRSTFTVLAGMRQPLVRRSWMRFGLSCSITP